jgi:hypothetical protein
MKAGKDWLVDGEAIVKSLAGSASRLLLTNSAGKLSALAGGVYGQFVMQGDAGTPLWSSIGIGAVSGLEAALMGKASTTHDHAGVYAPVDHNHNTAYALLNHDHNSAYSPLDHNHAGVYAPVDHSHVFNIGWSGETGGGASRPAGYFACALADFGSFLVSDGGDAGLVSLQFANTEANTVWAGPTSGGNSYPRYRSLVTEDLPGSSDVRLKTNVRPFTGGLAEVLALKTYQWEFNGLGGERSGDHEIGVLAHESREIIPDCVYTRRRKLHPSDTELTDISAVARERLIFYLINAVQELSRRTEDQQQ